MRNVWTLASTFAPLLFMACAAGSLALQSTALSGLEPDGPPEAMAEAVRANGARLGAFVTTATLAGLALLVLADALARQLPALPWPARAAAALWAVGWLAAATFAYAAIDLAGHFDHPPGVKTSMYLSYASITSPAGATLAGVLALGVGLAARGRAGWPGWYARFSFVAGALILVGGATLALSFSGMLGLLALPLWLVVTAVVLPLAARRAQGTVSG